MNNKLTKDEIQTLRSTIRQSLPDVDPGVDPCLSVRRTYVPPSHVKALQAENVVVIGMRGAGKSFWTAALSSPPHREFIQAAYPDTKIQDKTTVSVGFGTEKSSKFPSASVIARLIDESQEPATYSDLWRAVIISQMGYAFPHESNDTWRSKYLWVKDNPEIVENFFRNYDRKLGQKNESHFILFDALDRLASKWQTIRPLANSLFQTALDFQSYRSIHLKLFVRPDMLEDREITAFPDASKLLARKVFLDWRKVDLFALLFQSLANADGHGGNVFRDIVEKRILQSEWKKTRNIYTLPDKLRRDEDVQKRVFEAITGEFMAPPSKSAHKRGFPYTWLPNHLMDGRGEVSPRSFCAALREAADHDSVPDSWEHPLHYKGIQSGVQKASQIRVDEVSEDYPWVVDALNPCRNVLSLPAKPEDFFKLWKESNIVDTLLRAESEENHKLSPRHLDQKEKGLLTDLDTLGIVSQMADGRVQMPDVYRVAFGIIRKGGVPRIK